LDSFDKSDNDLMEEFSNCSEAAYKAILIRYEKRLLNHLILRFGQSRDDAEDIVWETLEKVYKCKFTYKPTYQFSTWIYTLCQRRALNEIRRKKFPRLSDIFKLFEPKSENPNSLTSTERKELSDVIKEIICGLEPKFKEIIVLRFYDGLPYEEISQITGKRINTLKSLSRRGLIRIKIELEKRGFEKE